MGLIALFVAYASSLYYPIQIIFGISGTGTPFYIFSGFVLICSLYAFFKNRFILKSDFAGLTIAAIVIGLYYLTGCLYGPNGMHSTQLLSGIGRFFPAVIMGVAASRQRETIDEMAKYAKYFMLIYTVASILCIFKVGVNTLNSNLLVYNMEGGVTYQDISYFAANAFGLTLFILTRNDENQNTRILLWLFLLIQFFCMAASGGRGGFVLICVYILYFSMRNFSPRKILKYAAIIICAIFVVNILSNNARFSYGFNRITNFFGNKDVVSGDVRWDNYELAFEAFKENPLFGNGIGSIFYKIGFYSHDVFIDFLCEGGISLILIFVLLVCSAFREGMKNIRENENLDLVFVVFFASFVLLLFSSYYLAETGIWFSIAYLISSKFRLSSWKIAEVE